jgi:zinc protease
MYKELETMEGQASNMGYYQLLGDFRLADHHREAVAAVTADQLIDVARRYFHPENCSLVSYVPEGNGVGNVEAGMRAVLSADGSVTEIESRGAAVAAPPDTADARMGTVARSSRSGEVSLFELENGVRVLFKPNSTTPLISLLTVFQGGGRFEPSGKSGLATLTHRSVVKGTEKYSADEIVERIEGLGGSIDSYGNFDTGGLYMGVLSDPSGLDAALDVYEEVLRRPSFEAERVVREREQALEELAQRHDNPIHLAMDALFRDVFGYHPYAWPFFGNPEEASVLTESDCAGWYKSLLVPANAVVTMVGDIDESRARDAAEKLMGDLPAGPIPTPHAGAGESPVTPGVHVLRKKDLQQSVTFVGYTAPPMLTDDAIALDVLNGILSGLGGRLFVELRDKRSLGYMTGSAFNSLKQRSLFFGYANPSADGIDEAVSVIQAELDKVTKELVTDVEIERSKEWLIGSQLMRLQRNGSQATSYGTYEALGFGYGVVDRAPEMIQAVTREAIRDAASRVFVPENVVVVKLLPEG